MNSPASIRKNLSVRYFSGVDQPRAAACQRTNSIFEDCSSKARHTLKVAVRRKNSRAQEKIGAPKGVPSIIVLNGSNLEMLSVRIVDDYLDTNGLPATE